MKFDESNYNEYVNWKIENDELLKKINSYDNDIFYRLKHVYDVIEYYYDKLIDDSSYSEEDDVIFQTGFYYLFEQFEEIKELLNNVYNKNYDEMMSNSKDVNLYLNVKEFQNEVIMLESNNKNTNFSELMKFDQEVYDYLLKKEHAPEEVFLKLDNIMSNIYEELKTSFNSVNTIFLEIADELNIL
ncbi:hypothetical protein [Haploplasma modicum]|uniref:hypothetical protein n=1 Tax=Haploplasma modicum TaxID=2150 RepID=UPI00214AC619|nr:hypothetical protein [Haploplasma modicum]MCR1809337.1 hypothetical protein [Haploplasma modicum]